MNPNRPRKENPVALHETKKRHHRESLSLRDVRDKIHTLKLLLSDPGRTKQGREEILLKIERLSSLR